MAVVYNNAKLLEMRATLHDRAAEVVSGTAYAIEAEAKVHSPRDPERPPMDPTAKVTGALRNSIQATMVDPLKWRVNVGQAYAPFLEFGTSKMIARPFLVPAVEKFRQSFLDKIAALVAMT